MNIWSFPRDKRDPKYVCEVAKSLGYEAVEFAVYDEDVFGEWSNVKRKWESIKETAESYGLKTPSVASGLYWMHGMLCEKPEKALRILEGECRIASLIGAEVVLFTLGPASPEVEYAKLFEYASKALKEVCRICREYAVKCGLENVWNKFPASPLEAKKLLEECGCDCIGLYFDPGNTLPHSHPEHWIHELGSYIVGVHIKDFDETKLTFVPPGRGSLDWRRIVSLLKSRTSFRGYAMAEVPPYPSSPVLHLEDTIAFMRRVLQHE